MSISIGKLRGLRQLADDSGIMAMCAIDHRGALKRALNSENPEMVSYRDMVDFKLDLCQAVAPFASAILLDPVYGVGPAIAAGVLPGDKGLLVSVEKTGYAGEAHARITEILPGWSVKKIKKLGASAVKLLLYFRPDLGEVTLKQLELVSRLADECLEEDIPLLVEPVSYPVAGENGGQGEFWKKKPELVIETARRLTALPIDVLKTEFPADINHEDDESKLKLYCQELNRESRLPWVLLSAGVDFDFFRRQVKIACEAGASGFLAGRALWQEGAGIKARKERMSFFETTAAPRLKDLSELARSYGTPWYAKLNVVRGEFPPVADGWWLKY